MSWLTSTAVLGFLSFLSIVNANALEEVDFTFLSDTPFKGTIKITVPKNAYMEDLKPLIKESIQRAQKFSEGKNSPKDDISTEFVMEIVKKTIAYALAADFDKELMKSNSESATLYAIAAVLNGAHRIDDGFLYTLYDRDPELTDKIEEIATKKENFDTVFKRTKKVVEALIMFEKPNPNRPSES